MMHRQMTSMRAELQAVTAYQAAQPSARVRLNNNENPYGPSGRYREELLRALAIALDGINRYPDPDARRMREALAEYAGDGLTADNVWAGNGSNEVLLQLLMAFGGAGRTMLGFLPTFAMHPHLAAITGTRWIGVARGEDFSLSADAIREAVRTHRPDIVVLCAPNNPTGHSLADDCIAAALDAAEGMVVVDEAYVEFSGRGSCAAEVTSEPRLVVLRTMSKAFAFAGVRSGYLVADPQLVHTLRLTTLPYHLSTLTQIATTLALRYADHVRDSVARIRDERLRLVDRLRARGLDVCESDANFLLFGVVADDAELLGRLLARGVLIRNVGPAGWLRVSVGRPEENDAFVAALDNALPGLLPDRPPVRQRSR